MFIMNQALQIGFGYQHYVDSHGVGLRLPNMRSATGPPDPRGSDLIVMHR